MNDQHSAPCRIARKDAINVSDFVYAATGTRVRRLTLPTGEHWFPAADVCRELGYTTTRKALIDHVPEGHRELLETVTGGHSLSIPAGREWRRDLRMIDLQGLMLLVNGCTKPSCAPFKEWVTNVIITIQRDGSYSLDKAEVQPTTPEAPAAYAMPQQVADAIVRLEEMNLRADERAAAAQQEANEARWATQRTLASVAHALDRLADSTARIADRLRPEPSPEERRGEDRMTAEELLSAWRARLTITEDVWAVAVLIAPAIVAGGQARFSVAWLAARSGLSEARVHDSLRFLLKRQAIRQTGSTPDGAPVYALHHA
jgi:prophage antirepressor-like protein